LSGKESPHKVRFIAFLMLLFVTGCGDPDRNTETAGLNPTVVSVTPANGSPAVCSLAVITATFSEAMNPATINTTTFTVSPGVTGIITHDVSNTIFTFAPSSPLAVSTSYTATINTRARNLFGVGLAHSFVWSFNTAPNPCNPPPVVVSATPVNGATGVCSLAAVTATLSSAMNASSINTTTFTVSPGVTGTITHDVSATIFTFTPSSSLAINTLYTATLTSGVRDLFGNGLASDFVWSFTTAANGCNPPPTVISETPANGSAGVCSNAVITATFSEAMNASSINTSTFIVSPGVTGTITHDVTDTVFTLTPSSPLAINTLYTATLATGIRDLFGNGLASDSVWSFTTAANGCNPLPTVISETPANGSAGVCSNAVIVATFSEAMNIPSINSTTFTIAPGVTGTITHDLTNTIFTLTPSSPLAINTVYTATITTGVRDTFGNALATDFVWSFRTAVNGCNPPPTVVSVTPLNGATGVCSLAVVTATFNEAMNTLSISAATFTVTPGVTGTITHDVSNAIFTFTPSSALAIGTVYTATLTTGAQDTFGNSLATDFVWSFRTAANGCNPPPTVISVTPANGATGVCSLAVVTATFSEAMNPSSINSTTFTIAPGVTGTITHDVSATIFTFTPSSPLAINTLYTATLTTGVRDLFGNGLASDSVWTFTTAANGCNPPPTVVSVTPLNGVSGVCPNTIVTASFSEAMDQSSIDGTTFTLTGPGSAIVSGQVSYDALSDTAIFTPSSGLALNTLYTATITTGVIDMFGNFLASDFVWTFTTGANPCQPPAPPISETPPNGSVGVCPNTLVAVTFPQAMDPSSINITTFTVTPGITGTITPDASNTIFTFTPSSDLSLNTTYTATITTGAKDAFGNALASNFVWTFRTGATSCPPPPPPTVISVSPANGSGSVCPNTVITATFSEEMYAPTINTTTFTLAPGVTGTVTLDGTGRIATFTPSSNLALSTTYTATITTGAQDLFLSGVASDFAWSFTTATLACQTPVPLGSAANFEILASSTVTNAGLTIITGGDLGLSPGTSVTGFPPGVMTLPAVMHIADAVAAQGKLDLAIAYDYAEGLTGAAALPLTIDGLTFTPGLYKSASSVLLSVGNVTLDAQGNANAVFIFQVGSTLTTIGSTQVILAGGAQAKNIFWQIGSSATLGTYSVFKGTIMALASITVNTGATLDGRALARNAAVTLDTNAITAP
jgi:Ice-binding-like/Bacterial Ig-like domain